MFIGRRGQRGGYGQGRQGGNRPGGDCICPNCGHRVEHEAAKPCYQVNCPRCGTAMQRECRNREDNTPMACGTLMAVCASEERTQPKTDIWRGELRAGYGLIGDSHASFSEREVSLIAYESILKARAEFGIDARPGCFADNFAIQGLDFSAIRVGDRIQMGTSLLEVVQIGKPPDAPHTYDFQGVSLLREEGLFCRVLHGGIVQRGDLVIHIPAGQDARQEQTP